MVAALRRSRFSSGFTPGQMAARRPLLFTYGAKPSGQPKRDNRHFLALFIVGAAFYISVIGGLGALFGFVSGSGPGKPRRRSPPPPRVVNQYRLCVPRLGPHAWRPMHDFFGKSCFKNRSFRNQGGCSNARRMTIPALGRPPDFVGWPRRPLFFFWPPIPSSGPSRPWSASLFRISDPGSRAHPAIQPAR